MNLGPIKDKSERDIFIEEEVVYKGRDVLQHEGSRHDRSPHKDYSYDGMEPLQYFLVVKIPEIYVI